MYTDTNTRTAIQSVVTSIVWTQLSASRFLVYSGIPLGRKHVHGSSRQKTIMRLKKRHPLPQLHIIDHHLACVFLSIMLKRLRPVKKVFCHNAHGRVRNRESNPEAARLFAQVRGHCDNEPRQIGLNHNYNMIFSISPCECQYSPLKIRIWCSKREPFRVFLPLLRHVELSPHNARRKGRCARDVNIILLQ